MKPRVLIVDDDTKIASKIEDFLEDLSGGKKRLYGIDEFIFDKAYSGEKAFELLEQAESSSSPYSLVLLDLQLPFKGTDETKSTDVGFKILKHAIEQHAALGVIVVSQFDEYENVVKAFPFVAVDFIAKPLTVEILQQKVLSYFEREGLRILDQRIKRLIPHAQKGLEYQLGTCFTSFLQKVIDETEALEKGFSERWGLDVDSNSQDRHLRHLIELDKSAKKAKEEWRKIQYPLASGDENQTEPALEGLLKEIEAEALPCLMLKNVELIGSYKGTTRILSFDNDVKVVLSEIILGALSQVPHHHNSRGRIELFVNVREEYAELCLEDNLQPIPHSDAESINQGGNAIRKHDFKREWGLSLAQFVAIRGGGRLMIEPKKDRGNITTYRIPLARHE